MQYHDFTHEEAVILKALARRFRAKAGEIARVSLLHEAIVEVYLKRLVDSNFAVVSDSRYNSPNSISYDITEAGTDAANGLGDVPPIELTAEQVEARRQVSIHKVDKYTSIIARAGRRSALTGKYITSPSNSGTDSKVETNPFESLGYSSSDIDEALGFVSSLGVKNVQEGGGPFSAAIYKDGKLLCTGVNRVTDNFDPTAHAEVQAIRNAGQILKNFSLKGCLLVSSCEPCPMCLTASLWARLDGVVFGADRYDAADIGFDDSEFYELFSTPREQWSIPVRQVKAPVILAPFQEWTSQDNKTEY